jgi:alkylhydroperoxidase family enzyme
MSDAGFLATPEHSAEVQQLFDEDIAEQGYVMNCSRLWSYQPATLNGLFGLMRQTVSTAKLTMRQRGILVTACASTLRDGYCSMAWGAKLAREAGPLAASAGVRGHDEGLSDDERAMAAWARKIVRDPNATTMDDIEALRNTGFSDPQIFAMTVFVALRLAFSTVNDALGAQPDAELFDAAPEEVAAAVTFGRPRAPWRDGRDFRDLDGPRRTNGD